MQSEIFAVKNVKCGGCVANIAKGLASLPGVDKVDVEISGGRVTVQGNNLDRAQIAARLREIGYPEAP
jgi:copper chaperone CopZ